MKRAKGEVNLAFIRDELQIMKTITEIIEKYPSERPYLLEMAWEIQNQWGYLSEEALTILAKTLKTSLVDLRDTLSFYHFFHLEPAGKYKIYLNQGLVAEMHSLAEIAQTFEEETGLSWGASDEQIGLYRTSCIGMCDQEPACLVNETVLTRLTPAKVKRLVAHLRQDKDLTSFVEIDQGEGQNQQALIHSEIRNHLRKKGALLQEEGEVGVALKNAYRMQAHQVIEEVKNAGLRGRGGAGFSTGLKWSFCAKTTSERRYIVCNADEGEPGTFKDRVLLTEYPQRIFEGMSIAGYAVQAQKGFLYLRAEYRYLKKYLEFQLKRFYEALDTPPFPIEIRLGAGAYVCGEETALLESLEGKRGEPRYRPPFPTSVGYLGYPTVINNVETFVNVTKILQKGALWYKSFGTEKSSGTRLLSVSGDCKYPGIYEVEWGISIQEVLDSAGSFECQAVQVGGPSGTLVPATEFFKRIALEEVSTAGAFIILGKDRSLLEVVRNFMNFFAEESCGTCVPCRVGTSLLRDCLSKIMEGKGTQEDLEHLKTWSHQVRLASRCGLGNVAPQPILQSLRSFRSHYEALISRPENPLFYAFDLEKAEEEYDQIVEKEAKGEL
jgi:[NiFe] hydrogenase diaphorase moiety large subunit